MDVDTWLYGMPGNIIKSKYHFVAVYDFICETG
jgi:hypothetical protein